MNILVKLLIIAMALLVVPCARAESDARFACVSFAKR